MKKEEKFMGGTIKFVQAAKDQKMPNGEIRSWEKSVKIVSGKTEIKVGKSFFEKMAWLNDDDEVRAFVEDLE